MAIIQGPGNAMAVVMALTVIASAATCAAEASKLGMRYDSSRGTYSPSQWGLSVLLLWVISYPMYLFKRRTFGVPNLLAPGLFVAAIFLGSFAAVSVAIEHTEGEINVSLESAREAFQSVENEIATFTKAAPAPETPSSSTPANSTMIRRTSEWGVLFGLFSKRENAESLDQELKRQGVDATVYGPDYSGLWRVALLNLPDRTSAEKAQAQLRRRGFPAVRVITISPE